MAYQWIMRTTNKPDAINVKLRLFRRHLDPATNSVARGAMFYTNLNHTGKTAVDAMGHDPIANGVMAKYTSFINI
jgi:hypothetical protein